MLQLVSGDTHRSTEFLTHCWRTACRKVSSENSPVVVTDCCHSVYFNFKQHHISPSAYLPDWLIPLFLDHLPIEACARLWDVLLLEGDAFLFRAALAVLGVLEPRLFFPDKKELLDLLK